MNNPELSMAATVTPARRTNSIPEQTPKLVPTVRTVTGRESRYNQQTQEEIHYPESDGMPMAENTVQYKHLTNIAGNLEILYKKNPNVFIAGDLFWYPVKGSNTIKYAPDVLVVFGRPKGDRGSYMQWKEDNIPPQIVFEIWSPGNDQEIKDKKFAFYNRYGVEEYYTYDPDREKIEGWIRRHGSLRPISSMLGWHSPQLGIRFTLKDTENGRQMQLYYPDGRPFLSRVEESDAREAAEKQSEVDRTARVEAEDKAKREAERRQRETVARAEAEALAQREADERQREAAARAKAEAQAQRETAARAEAEAQAQRESDERQREAAARVEAEALAQREADERQREAAARAEAEAQARHEADERQREALARAEAENEAARAKALLQAAMEQLQKSGLSLPDIDSINQNQAGYD